MKNQHEIFISYRRSDSIERAQLLKKIFVAHGYRESDVFLDLHDIEAENFVDRCHEAIMACRTFVLVVSNDSFTEKKANGGKIGKDYYYDEIMCALEHNKKIIPVLFDAHFDKQSIPKSFVKRGLDMTNALSYNAEYTNDFENKLMRFVSSGEKKTILNKIAAAFVMPALIITLYLGVSLLGGVLRYIWDSYWLSDETCLEIAASALQKSDTGDYYYVTRDTIYKYSTEGQITKTPNAFLQKSGLTINVQSSDIYKAGFWTVAVSLIYEVSNHNIKPHGGGKKMAAIIAAGLTVAAGFGLGFVIERMIFPVQESRLIRTNLNNSSFWNKIIEKRSVQPWIEQKF